MKVKLIKPKIYWKLPTGFTCYILNWHYWIWDFCGIGFSSCQFCGRIKELPYWMFIIDKIKGVFYGKKKK